MRTELLYCVSTIGCFTNDNHIGLNAYKTHDALADDRMVVNRQNADL